MTDEIAREEFFSFPDEQIGFDKGMLNRIRCLSDEKRDAVIPPDNIISYTHGTGWISLTHDQKTGEKAFTEHRHETSVKFEDVINQKLSIIEDYLSDIVNGMHSLLMKSVYQTVQEAADSSGNVVDAKEHHSTADAFLAAIRKIEFGVNKNGEISRPEFHVSAEGFDNIFKNLEAQGEEFSEKVKEIVKEKEAEAFKRETMRKNKFVKENQQK